MAFRDYRNNDRFERDRRDYQRNMGAPRDARDFDNRSDWSDGRRDSRYDRGPDYPDTDRARMSEYDSRERYGTGTRYGTGYTRYEDDDPYIRDQRRLRERGDMRYGRDYGYAASNYYYQSQRDYDPRDRQWGSENLDAQQNYEADRPNFRGGGWDQGESMRSRHSQPAHHERDAYEADRNYDPRREEEMDRRAGRYTRDPNAWSSMEHDWNADHHYYGRGQNRTGDYGSRNETYGWRDNFGKDRVYSRGGRGTTTGWAGGDRSLGSSDL